jgi:hypothetical protein
MVSVMLLTLSMLTVATLVVRSSSRNSNQVGASVARERALMAAHSAVDLAAAQYRRELFSNEDPDNPMLSEALAGANPPLDPSLCMREDGAHPDRDCIPGEGVGVPLTGQRNHLIGLGNSDCAGRPCMRPGALVNLDDASFTPVTWSQVAMSQLVAGGDAEAKVSVWVRNNSVEALGSEGTGSWVVDSDRRIVLTAMATVRNTTVAVEQEYYFKPGSSQQPAVAPTPDDGYGGGHHNDNVAVAVCKENYATLED